MNINYDLTQNQYDFINAKEFFKLMIGGVGFGKSYAAAIDCFIYAMENPGAVIIYVAPTNDMLKNVNIKLFMELIPEELIFRYNAMSLEIEFVNGTIILFRSAGDEARIQRLRGLSVAKIMIDEICSLNKSVWDVLVGRLRQKGYPLSLGAVGSPVEGWVHRLIDKNRDNKKYWIRDEISTETNIFAVDGYVENLRETYTSDFYNREVLGKWISFEGLIWDSKIKEDIPEGIQETYYGSDIGYSSPTAIIVVKKSNNILYVVDEFYRSHANDDELIEEFKRLQFNHGEGEIFVDPAYPKIIDLLNYAGMNACKATNNVMDGLRTVRTSFDNNKLYIHPRCKNLLEEIESYTWKDSETKEEPVKINDHACDALRYCCMGATEINVKTTSGAVIGR